MIKNNADRLPALANDLLDMSRVKAGKIELHRAEVDLSALIRAVAALRPRVEAKRQRLSLVVAALLLVVCTV